MFRLGNCSSWILTSGQDVARESGAATAKAGSSNNAEQRNSFSLCIDVCFVSFAEFTTVAFVEFASEALLHEVVKAIAEGFELHLVDDLVDEGIL